MDLLKEDIRQIVQIFCNFEKRALNFGVLLEQLRETFPDTGWNKNLLQERLRQGIEKCTFVERSSATSTDVGYMWNPTAMAQNPTFNAQFEDVCAYSAECESVLPPQLLANSILAVGPTGQYRSVVIGDGMVYRNNILTTSVKDILDDATTDDLPEGVVNLYFTTARARASISAADPITYNSVTGEIGFDGSYDGQLTVSFDGETIQTRPQTLNADSYIAFENSNGASRGLVGYTGAAGIILQNAVSGDSISLPDAGGLVYTGDVQIDGQLTVANDTETIQVRPATAGATPAYVNFEDSVGTNRGLVGYTGTEITLENTATGDSITITDAAGITIDSSNGDLIVTAVDDMIVNVTDDFIVNGDTRLREGLQVIESSTDSNLNFYNLNLVTKYGDVGWVSGLSGVALRNSTASSFLLFEDAGDVTLDSNSNDTYLLGTTLFSDSIGRFYGDYFMAGNEVDIDAAQFSCALSSNASAGLAVLGQNYWVDGAGQRYTINTHPTFGYGGIEMTFSTIQFKSTTVTATTAGAAVGSPTTRLQISGASIDFFTDIDMNSNDILNVNNITTDTAEIDGMLTIITDGEGIRLQEDGSPGNTYIAWWTTTAATEEARLGRLASGDAYHTWTTTTNSNYIRLHDDGEIEMASTNSADVNVTSANDISLITAVGMQTILSGGNGLLVQDGQIFVSDSSSLSAVVLDSSVVGGEVRVLFRDNAAASSWGTVGYDGSAAMKLEASTNSNNVRVFTSGFIQLTSTNAQDITLSSADDIHLNGTDQVNITGTSANIIPATLVNISSADVDITATTGDIDLSASAGVITADTRVEITNDSESIRLREVTPGTGSQVVWRNSGGVLDAWIGRLAPTYYEFANAPGGSIVSGLRLYDSGEVLITSTAGQDITLTCANDVVIVPIGITDITNRVEITENGDALRLIEGTDHNYISWYAVGGVTREAYLGRPTGASTFHEWFNDVNNSTIRNFDDGEIQLLSTNAQNISLTSAADVDINATDTDVSGTLHVNDTITIVGGQLVFDDAGSTSAIVIDGSTAGGTVRILVRNAGGGTTYGQFGYDSGDVGIGFENSTNNAKVYAAPAGSTLTITGEPIDLVGNVDVTTDDLTVTTGDLTVTAGNLDVTAGNITAGGTIGQQVNEQYVNGDFTWTSTNNGGTNHTAGTFRNAWLMYYQDEGCIHVYINFYFLTVTTDATNWHALDLTAGSTITLPFTVTSSLNATFTFNYQGEGSGAARVMMENFDVQPGLNITGGASSNSLRFGTSHSPSTGRDMFVSIHAVIFAT